MKHSKVQLAATGIVAITASVVFFAHTNGPATPSGSNGGTPFVGQVAASSASPAPASGHLTVKGGGDAIPATKPHQTAGNKNGVVASAAIAPRPQSVTVQGKQYPVRRYKTLSMPNDPAANQWWVGDTGLDSSWDIPAGSTQTTLAIIDTGFALKHEEFANRWYVNPGESGPTTQENPSVLNCTDRGLALDESCNLIDDNGDGIVDNEAGPTTQENPSALNCTDQGLPLDKSCNHIDDDGNGFIDDYRGWDFADGDNSPQAGEVDPSGSGTTHGTEVTGIAAATGNNGKGIAGVDWNTKILPLQAMSDDSYGDTLTVSRAINYAVSMHVDVISLSLGSSQPDDYVRQAVQNALKAGIVVVAAAGNDGCDCMVYPGAYPETLGVGALDSTNQPASFSSYGDNLDILAPGTDMTSAVWSSANPTSSYVSGINGTSFATPFVAGMLTRLKSEQPTAAPDQLIAALTETVNRGGLPATIPHDAHYGFGIVNANAAMTRMTTARTGLLPYIFTAIDKGDSLGSDPPAEPTGGGQIYPCNSGDTPSTAVYELVGSGTNGHFFTVSKVEDALAVAQGYSSDVLMYACMQQPQDNNSVMHDINVFHEFRNLYTKQ